MLAEEAKIHEGVVDQHKRPLQWSRGHENVVPQAEGAQGDLDRQEKSCVVNQTGEAQAATLVAAVTTGEVDLVQCGQ